MSNAKDFRPVGAELFREDGRIDITKVIVVFRNLANEPKMLPTRSRIWLEVSKLNHKLVSVVKHHAALSESVLLIALSCFHSWASARKFFFQIFRI
jgi:hypothetical protein